MNDDLEQRLRNSFRHSPLPGAPASLIDAMEHVPDAPVAATRRRRSVWVPLAVAAVLVIAAAVVVGGGQRGIAPAPTTAASPGQSGAASTAPGGVVQLEYQAHQVGGVTPTPADLDTIAAIVEHRLAALGVAGASVRVEGSDRVIVELPAGVDVQAMRTLVGQTGHLDFVPLGTTQVEVGDVIDPTKFPALFSGDQVESAAIGTSGGTGGRVVTFVLKPQGAAMFGSYTAANIGTYFAIVLDSKVISAPVINSEIPGGHVEISQGGVGGYDLAEAQNLVAILQFGELPFPIAEISNELVSPNPTAP
jgi:hypothetical protein